MRSIAAETRAAVDERPFVRMALRAGILNVAAVARFLDVNGDPDSIAAAIRRYGDDLPALATDDRTVRVTMERGTSRDLLTVDDESAMSQAGDSRDAEACTTILATGDVGPRYLAWVLDRLAIESVPILGVGLRAPAAVFVVPRTHGATALRIVEAATSTPSGTAPGDQAQEA